MRNNKMPSQGGLKTDGRTVDPVSGNEVPVGSNPKEVRDDIPAQLSEGEYVVPADIVRYYGVKFFEDLRNQGKGGLQNMAANGRIGGEPMQQFSQEEMQAMQGIVGAAQGGMMTKEKSGYYNGGFSFYPGGTEAEQSLTTPTRYTGEFSWETPAPSTDDEVDEEDTPEPITIYCPDGTVNVINLPQDQERYETLIANGCGIDESILPSGDTDAGEGTETQASDGTGWMENYGYKGDGTETFQDIADGSFAALDPSNRNFLEKLLSGGAIGKLQQGMTAAQVAANIAILKANATTAEERALVESLTAKWKEYVSGNNLDVLPKEFINGDQLAKQIVKTQVDWGMTEDATDVNGDPIFDSHEDFVELLEQAASDPQRGVTANYVEPNTEYTDPVTGETVTSGAAGVIVYDYGDQSAGDVLGGESLGTTDTGVEVFSPGEDTLRPVLRPAGVGDTPTAVGSTPVTPTTPSPEETTITTTELDPPYAGGSTVEEISQVAQQAIDQAEDPNATIREQIDDDLASTQVLFDQPSSGAGTDDPTITETVDLTSPEETVTYTYEDPGDSVDTPVYAGSSSDDDDDPVIPTTTGTAAYGGSQAAETALIQSDLSDDDFWDEFESGTSGSSSSSSTNTASTGRTESQIQADINQALQDSGGVWTSELNDLVSERDDARSNTGGTTTTSSGGGGGGGDSDDGDSGGGSGGGGGGCCFIMLEARYGNGTMDEVVRRYRDEYMTDRNRRGYYRLAEVLVPLMRKSKAFKWVITKTFADPLVSYGKYYYGQNKHGVLYSPVKNFWMKVFDIVGGDTKFIRENGEVV